MEIGVSLPNQFPAADHLPTRIREIGELVARAGDLGYTSLLAGEHRLSDPYAYLDPMTLLAAVAPSASHMRLVAMNLLALHHPVDVAEQCATLDAVCGGRLTLVAALGYRDVEFEAFGVARQQRLPRFLEALQLLTLLLEGGEVEFDGTYVRVPRTRICTTPTQPTLPIWLAANADVAVQRAGALGYPWFVNPHADLATIAAQAALHRGEYERSTGSAPVVAPIIREIVVDRDRGWAEDFAASHLAAKYATYHEWGQDRAIRADETFDRPFADLAARRFVVGTPEECARDLAEIADAVGATELFVHAHWPGAPISATQRILETFAVEVRPLLEEMSASRASQRADVS